MQVARPVFALCPRRFGRRAMHSDEPSGNRLSLVGDLKLFATTFAAGFLFVSILIG